MGSNLPSVSIVIPNFEGRRHLEICLDSLSKLDYARDLLEIVIVDNASRDGSADYVARSHPEVRLLRHDVNTGFARAVNHGAETSTAEVVVFLNNDVRVEPRWLRPLVEPIAAGEAAATTSCLLDWEGETIDFAGGGSNFHGIGIQLGYGRPARERGTAGETLFPVGGAMAADRETFLGAGGFDEDFFAYYEDVDLGWRLWILGWRVLYVPESTAFHRHSATAMGIPERRRRIFYVRNPLYALFKNYEQANLLRVLPAALLLTARRTYYQAWIREEGFRMVGPPPPPPSTWRERLAQKLLEPWGRMAVGEVAVADLVAVNDFLLALPELSRKREIIQRGRKRPDSAILPLFADPFWVVEPNEEFARLQSHVVEVFGLRALFPDG